MKTKAKMLLLALLLLLIVGAFIGRRLIDTVAEWKDVKKQAAVSVRKQVRWREIGPDGFTALKETREQAVVRTPEEERKLQTKLSQSRYQRGLEEIESLGIPKNEKSGNYAALKKKQELLESKMIEQASEALEALEVLEAFGAFELLAMSEDHASEEPSVLKLRIDILEHKVVVLEALILKLQIATEELSVLERRIAALEAAVFPRRNLPESMMYDPSRKQPIELPSAEVRVQSEK